MNSVHDMGGMHGMGPVQTLMDPAGLVIWGLEKAGLAWDVVRISPERQASKAA